MGYRDQNENGTVFMSSIPTKDFKNLYFSNKF